MDSDDRAFAVLGRLEAGTSDGKDARTADDFVEKWNGENDVSFTLAEDPPPKTDS